MKAVSGDMDAFRDLVKAIVAGDGDAVLASLDASPHLAHARAAYGATRQASSEHFFDDIAHYIALPSTGPKINDGAPHAIVVVRASGTLTVYIDGGASGSGVSGASLGPLPALKLGTDICVGAVGDSTVALVGQITDVCVSRSS